MRHKRKTNRYLELVTLFLKFLFFLAVLKLPAKNYLWIIRDVFKTLKETCNSFKMWPLNLWWISNKTIMEIGNVTEAATFKSFLHQSYKKTQLLFLWQCFLIISMRQTLTVDFLGLHKSKNCVFPLKYTGTNYLIFKFDYPIIIILHFSCLTHYSPMFLLLTPWKQKNTNFL